MSVSGSSAQQRRDLRDLYYMLLPLEGYRAVMRLIRLLQLRLLNEIRPVFRDDAWDPRRAFICFVYVVSVPLLTVSATSLSSVFLGRNRQGVEVQVAALAAIVLVTVAVEFFRATTFLPEAAIVRSSKDEPLLKVSYFTVVALFRSGFALLSCVIFSIVYALEYEVPVWKSLTAEALLLGWLILLGVLISIFLRRLTNRLGLSPKLAWSFLLPLYFLCIFMALSTFVASGPWAKVSPRFSLGLESSVGKWVLRPVSAGSEAWVVASPVLLLLTLLIMAGSALYLIRRFWADELIGEGEHLGCGSSPSLQFRAFSRRLSSALFQKDLRELWRNRSSRLSLGIVGLLLVVAFVAQYRRMATMGGSTKALILSLAVINVIPMLITGRSIVGEISKLDLYRQFRINPRELLNLKLRPQILVNSTLGVLFGIPFLLSFRQAASEMEVIFYVLALVLVLPSLTILAVALAVLFPVPAEGAGPFPLSTVALVVYLVIASLLSGVMFALHEAAGDPMRVDELAGFCGLLLAVMLSGPVFFLVACASLKRRN